jgi:hypothetical protein
MSLTRRGALRLGIAAPAAALIGGLAGPAAAAVRRSPYRRETWRLHRGRTFTMTSAGVTSRVELTSINDLRGGVPGHAHQFSLTFRARSRAAADGVVTLRRRGLGRVTLFVTRVDRGITATHYQAVINRPG